MREILFRGKMKNQNGDYKKNDWVYGDFVRIKDGKQNIPTIYGFGEVIANTVSQYTGLTDKNGTKIFEGDIVKSCENDDVYFVKYFDNDNYSAFDCVPDVPLCECNGLSFLVNEEYCEVVGNIYDNSELLGVM